MQDYIIWLLGHYNDKIVFEQLVKDSKIIQDQDIEYFENCYNFIHTSMIIETHREERFDLELELSRSRKTKLHKPFSELSEQHWKI